MTHNNKSIYFTAVFSKIFIVFLSLFTSAMVNRSLGVQLKGEYAYINNLVTICMVLFSLGLGQCYSTYRRKYGKICINTFTTLSVLQSIICLLLTIISIVLNLNFYVCITLFISTFSLLKNNLLYIAAIEDIKKRDSNNIIYKAIYSILVFIVFILKIRSLNIMIALFILEEIVVVIGIIYNYNLKFDIKSLINNNKIGVIKLYKVGIISMFMVLMMSFNYNLDIIFLKQLATSYDVGLYSIAVQLANMLWLIPDAFKDVVFFKTAKADSIKEIISIIKFNIYINVFIIFGFLLFGKLFIDIMYGYEYLGSFSVTLMLFVGGISMTIYKLIHPLYIAKGKQKIIFCILLVSVISNSILNYIFIPIFGIVGAALSSIFSYTLCGMIFLLKFCKEYNVHIKDIFVVRKEEINRIKKYIYKILKGKKNEIK